MQMRSDSDSDAQSDSLPITEDELGDQPDVPSIFDLSLSRPKDFRAYACASKLGHQSTEHRAHGDRISCTIFPTVETEKGLGWRLDMLHVYYGNPSVVEKCRYIF